jgi:16S rRNA (adenine1518-N6/adenine1519-N6)-dimethyltransferase
MRRPGHSRRFGQHFLQPEWVRKLVDLIDPRPDDVFLEIGPGGGALTGPLTGRAARVVAVEVDRELAAALRASAPQNLTIVEDDILDLDLAALVDRHAAGRRVRIAGNLPYNISSPILFRLVDWHRRRGGVEDATLMLQLEVADRLAAAPGSRQYGVLPILVGVHADIERVLTLPPGAFRPPPTVRSAVVRLRFRPPPVAIADEAAFEALVRTIFTQRRKTLANALKPFAETRGLAAATALARAGLDGRRRPETLQLADLARLAAAFSSADGRAVL